MHLSTTAIAHTVADADHAGKTSCSAPTRRIPVLWDRHRPQGWTERKAACMRMGVVDDQPPRMSIENLLHMGLTDLKGKWVLVTGAAAGIGRATALAFADAGASLIVTDIDAERLEAVCREVSARGSLCESQWLDVGDEAAVAGFAHRLHQRLPALDVLVNNAGIGYIGSFVDCPLEAWQRVLRVNLMGVVHCCQAFLPAMRRAGGARRVVNIASLAGVAPAPNMSAYAASKHAVMGLSEGLKLELSLARSEVGVTVVCPGIINTDITKARHNVSAAISDAQYERLTAYYAAQGVGPEVVALAIVAGVRASRDIVLVGPFAKPVYHLRRLSRRLAQWLMLVDARKAGYA
jgi:NAD(P)-dependent dehydrogenase (short-subunit alcohol dehydrogenase family)